jgi:hypothetical protein
VLSWPRNSAFRVRNLVAAKKHSAFRPDPTGELALRGREGGKSEPGLDEAERTAFVGSLILPQQRKVRKRLLTRGLASV